VRPETEKLMNLSHRQSAVPVSTCYRLLKKRAGRITARAGTQSGHEVLNKLVGDFYGYLRSLSVAK
jgi:hypothetical protein